MFFIIPKLEALIIPRGIQTIFAKETNNFNKLITFKNKIKMSIVFVSFKNSFNQILCL